MLPNLNTLHDLILLLSKLDHQHPVFHASIRLALVRTLWQSNPTLKASKMSFGYMCRSLIRLLARFAFSANDQDIILYMHVDLALVQAGKVDGDGVVGWGFHHVQAR